MTLSNRMFLDIKKDDLRRLLMYCLLPLSVCFFSTDSNAQDPTNAPPVNNTTEQQLEAITEVNEDAETEDDSYLLKLQEFLKNPVNLNYADETELKELVVLSPAQIQNIISYRNLFGKFIDLYELQAIPAWDIYTIDKIRPYISVSERADVFGSIGDRLSGGDHSILIRATQILEKSKGYKVDPATTKNYYPGSPQRLFVRYRYHYKNLLQYGIVGEKDAGEQFFKGGQKQGFDFYSAHFFVRNIGIVKALALGDFTVNLGQGLTQWQNLAFKKSVDVTNIKRQLPVLRPYNSAGEINFHRGIGITVAKRNIEATVFASYRKIDANFNVDTLNNEDFISSLQTSGYHRTASELEDKGAQRQIAFGGNVAYNKDKFHVGVNGIQYNFEFPINKADDPYNMYALSGSNFGNYSVDYSYTYKNLHFFGEAATTSKSATAFVNGMILSVANNIDMSMLYRNISKKYQSLYTNAFTESTFPTNEKGLYTGISIRPNSMWRIDAYADFYKFPWLKFQVDAPSTGADYLIQATYKPNKQLEMYLRYRTETKSGNYNPSDLTFRPVVPEPKQNLRTQISYKVSPTFTMRQRVEIVWFDKRGPQASNGFLSYADLIYKPMMKKYSGNIRLQYFETDDYNSRLYAYENDVLYSFSIPVFYEKGFRYYVNVNYDFSKKLSFWLRLAQTINEGKSTVGSGLDEIKGNRKTEVKLQLQYLF
ncbi:helix-hairpin-helix domain-containing protein [Ferruginibacter lapsinanis]|uniref:ComEA family DNA-binding protein n=1 Tax=Ferruginibacter lapsinanis TaxID=563172 RepID=UPI001E61E746|nr:helix-hairpin-helix domain-containing protein [Ferruginibacter lapsinanis]UEG48503.1 helix-hairpin-helix domain-containing protein [Ferruginibacter lapsinanis]